MKARKVIGMSIMIISVLVGFYIGVWELFAEPIIELCKVIDAGELTAKIIGILFVKMCLSGIIGGIISFAGLVFGSWLMGD